VKQLIFSVLLLSLISTISFSDPNDSVYFADTNLETIVADALGVALPITEGQLEYLYILSANSAGISKLTGLEYATNLRELYLSSNMISDASAISELTGLTKLYLNNNQISDISALSNLVNLNTLFLSINQITDISAVSGLPGLSNLYLGNNQVIDISDISGLTNLAVLDLTNNQVIDISVVSNLTNLEYLYLPDNQISNISGLLSLGKLISLLLGENPLNSKAYCIDLPIIRDNNPGLITLAYDPNPNPFTRNCTTNQAELSAFAAEWLDNDCNQVNNWCSGADLDHLNNVNLSDLAEFGLYWQQEVACPHDECGDAIEIMKCEIYSGSSVESTGSTESSCGQWDYFDVWHSYTPDSNELVDISLCGSAMDTTLAVYDSCGGMELACSDDYCGYQSQVTLELTAGETYLIRVAAYDEETGDYVLTITDAPEPPVNDTCENAVEVLYGVSSVGSSLEATGTDITSCTVNDIRDVWYYFVPVLSGRYLLDLDGSDYDTSLAVFDGCEVTELACNDDYYPSPAYVSRIIVSLAERHTYYIRISGYDSGGGNYSLLVSLASDINKDGSVDMIDLSLLAQEWMHTGTSASDIGPKGADGGGDMFIDLLDFAEFCKQWARDTSL